MEKADDAIFVHLDPLTTLFFRTVKQKQSRWWFILGHANPLLDIIGKQKLLPWTFTQNIIVHHSQQPSSSTKKGNIERGVYGRILT
jgi:hypothetical protein